MQCWKKDKLLGFFSVAPQINQRKEKKKKKKWARLPALILMGLLH